ncbi:MAG: hypothetical protein LBM93_14760 [Oscillospiraceae bacterium]|jgi:hypothetical protein|nr:hypothetical protein [Oscillospiraceae bacterium]
MSKDISKEKAEQIIGIKLPHSISERRKFMRKRLPYGVYVLPDKSEVLFNRDYELINYLGEPISEDISDYESRYWFYNDGSVPDKNIEVLMRISEVLDRKANNPKESVEDLAKFW